jgi:hypothetical protein
MGDDDDDDDDDDAPAAAAAVAAAVAAAAIAVVKLWNTQCDLFIFIYYINIFFRGPNIKK